MAPRRTMRHRVRGMPEGVGQGIRDGGLAV